MSMNSPIFLSKGRTVHTFEVIFVPQVSELTMNEQKCMLSETFLVVYVVHFLKEHYYPPLESI